jgi:mono/diheme cytochrome c family protein
MVRNFHWLWAIEWTFFCLEIAAGYCFYRCHTRISDRSGMILLLIYCVAAWMSLFIINGILSWQLTPGRWLETRSVVDGFFNPSFWPSLLFRTVVSTTLAALAACVVVNWMDIDRSAKTQLINRVSHLLIPMVAMPLLGGWFLAVIPADSRSWVMGGSAAMMLFFSVSIAASLAIGAYAMVGMVWQKMYINGATATLLLMLAFGATAGGEFVREGARKPFTIRQVLYSNSIRPEDVERLREVGCLADDPYPIRDAGAYPDEQLREGARVFRRQCAVCHTVKGANAVVHLTGSWDIDQMRMNIAKLQHTKPFMPPFAGTAAELESLVQFILWSSAGSPATRVPDDQAVNHETLRQITHWLEEAGTKPGVFDRNHHAPSKSDKSDSDTGANHG